MPGATGASRNKSYALAVEAKPFGIGIPSPAKALYSSPRPAALPPTMSTSVSLMSLNQRIGPEASDALGPSDVVTPYPP